MCRILRVDKDLVELGGENAFCTKNIPLVPTKSYFVSKNDVPKEKKLYFVLKAASLPLIVTF